MDAAPQHEQQHAPHPRRLGPAVAASILAVGLVGGGAAALGLKSVLDAGGPAVAQSPTSTTEQLPFTGSQRRFGSSYGWTPPQSGDSGDGSGTAPQQTSDATAAQSAGIVEITSTLTSGKSAGTGMVLSADGTVVTNHHVVEGATSIAVTVPATGKTYTARYVGADATRDVAVLKLNGAAGLATVHPSGSAAGVGDAVTSVGDANGDGGSLTAASGTVTAQDQSITVQGEDGTPNNLTGLLELNADLVPGDSGGAVLDGDGDVVAMNVAASTGGATVTGYAIPISTVTAVADQILRGDASGTVDLGYHGYLGVGLDPQSSLPLVASTVDGGAAKKAGIVAGDTITSVNGVTVTTATRLRAALAKLDPGDRAVIGWTTSAGAHHSATLTLGRAPVS
jgi:S1-C subfamily serine protease